MKSKRPYNALIILLGIFVLAIGGFAQGKHGGGDKHGGGGKQENRGQDKQRGNNDEGNRRGDEGNRGNGNGWGRQKGGEDQQRAYQQQQRQQNDQAREQQRQQQQIVWDAQRRQQQADRRQYDDRNDRGKHKGWDNDGPRGNAYGLRGIWPGEDRGWRDENKQERKDAKRHQRSDAYYYADPLNSYYPAYRQPNYGYNNSNGYNPRPTRESIIRSIISSFFAPEPTYYNNNYGAAPVYQGYAPAYNGYQQPYYGGYNPQNYSQASYSPGYGSQNYNQGYNPYGNSPMYGTQIFGGGGLKSSLLNIGLGLLQGFLGQGYQQGLDQGVYARDNYSPRSNNYYDPYASDQPAYDSPYSSSFADQRQLLEEGYRLGYQDAMMNRDPYGTGRSGRGNVDVISQFLANTLLDQI